eukprot:gnl/Spiro4/26503_TR13188_c0_g1_i1.p1 gnl/Spiro4/26503_TR13188_c0_g1~~gnl/Spiro4/26503_TR13188_c0_g1_i1.p1  ORF type:complete len:611 (-),score=208.15 gnl/Spiro4/26503_TR13188_c0_g1_i1:45-1877(-)
MALRDYEFIRQLGQGTFGRVLLVQKAGTSDLCVLKQVPLEGLSREDQDDVLNESTVMQALEHPNVIKHYESFIESMMLNIVMEYAPGGDLGQKIKAQGSTPFDEETLWNFFIQIAKGMRHLHKRRVLHRDLKPQNIFLDEHDQVKIGDMGLGRIMGPQSIMAHTGVGTPLYFSPELCEELPYDERSDIWAFGCLMYELAALRPPFVARNQIALAKKIVNDQPAPLNDRSYSMELQFLIFKMLEKDVRRRPDINQIMCYSAVRIRIERSKLLKREAALNERYSQLEAALRAEYAEREAALKTQESTIEARLEMLRDKEQQFASAAIRSVADNARAQLEAALRADYAEREAALKTQESTIEARLEMLRDKEQQFASAAMRSLADNARARELDGREAALLHREHELQELHEAYVRDKKLLESEVAAFRMEQDQAQRASLATEQDQPRRASLATEQDQARRASLAEVAGAGRARTAKPAATTHVHTPPARSKPSPTTPLRAVKSMLLGEQTPPRVAGLRERPPNSAPAAFPGTRPRTAPAWTPAGAATTHHISCHSATHLNHTHGATSAASAIASAASAPTGAHKQPHTVPRPRPQRPQVINLRRTQKELVINL